MKIKKIYSNDIAPNPRRVEAAIAFKGLDIDIETIDFAARQQLTPEYLEINPDGTIPVVIMEDGRQFTETTPILTLIEELYPEKPLFGSNIIEKVEIMSWMNKVFLQCFIPLVECLRNGHPMFENRALPGPREVAQIPALAERGKERLGFFWDKANAELADKAFLVNDSASQADIDLMVMSTFAKIAKLAPQEGKHDALRAHTERVKSLLG